MNKFMEIAIREAETGIKKGHGGPFGAIITKDGKIISKAHNMVIKKTDPTAHAEMMAIRKASKKLKAFDLSGCELYSTCEPCPMCLAAIHWARIDRLYYGCSAKDASNIGFDDKKIYNILRRKTKTDIKTQIIEKKGCLKAFKLWQEKENKILY